jgi:hypothetical protein
VVFERFWNREATLGSVCGRYAGLLADLPGPSGVDLEKVSALLDGSWRDYIKNRPSNADNLTFAKENISTFKTMKRAPS